MNYMKYEPSVNVSARESSFELSLPGSDLIESERFNDLFCNLRDLLMKYFGYDFLKMNILRMYIFGIMNNEGNLRWWFFNWFPFWSGFWSNGNFFKFFDIVCKFQSTTKIIIVRGKRMEERDKVEIYLNTLNRSCIFFCRWRRYSFSSSESLASWRALIRDASMLSLFSFRSFFENNSESLLLLSVSEEADDSGSYLMLESSWSLSPFEVFSAEWKW